MELQPLSARSIALSVLLGSPDGQLPVRDLLATGEMCGIAPPTMRVALSRLVAASELSTDDGTYALAPHHLERQRLQDADLSPAVRPWDGSWELVTVIETGRGAADRARLRSELTALRLAELREGVWMRPANLRRPLVTNPHTTVMLARPADPAFILASLWDLPQWTRDGRALLAASAGPALDGARFSAVTALVRHLRTDPALPAELTPPDWPADDMRTAYAAYRAELHSHHVQRQEVLT